MIMGDEQPARAKPKNRRPSQVRSKIHSYRNASAGKIRAADHEG